MPAEVGCSYTVLAFQTLDKGWVKVQLIPFKEKKDSSSWALQNFDPDPSEAMESSEYLESFRGL